VCEYVRKKSSRERADDHMWSGSVSTGRVWARLPTCFPSLRGWLSKECGCSNPPFRGLGLPFPRPYGGPSA